MLFLLAYREFRAAGTSVQGSKRTTVIARTGPYRFSRNPIYLAFILFVLGLSVWLKNLWLLITPLPAVGIIALVIFLDDWKAVRIEGEALRRLAEQQKA